MLRDAAAVDLAAIGAPASLHALVAARLDALTPAERRVVADASVLGQSFTRAAMQRLSPRTCRSRGRAGLAAAQGDPRRPDRTGCSAERGQLPVRPGRGPTGRLRHASPDGPQAPAPRRGGVPDRLSPTAATTSPWSSPSTCSTPSTPSTAETTDARRADRRGSPAARAGGPAGRPPRAPEPRPSGTRPRRSRTPTTTPPGSGWRRPSPGVHLTPAGTTGS